MGANSRRLGPGGASVARSTRSGQVVRPGRFCAQGPTPPVLKIGGAPTVAPLNDAKALTPSDVEVLTEALRRRILRSFHRRDIFECHTTDDVATSLRLPTNYLADFPR